MTEKEAEEIAASMQKGNAFQLEDKNNSRVYNYYFDMVDEHYCCLTIDKKTTFLKNSYVFEDFSALYQNILKHQSLELIQESMKTTMNHFKRFYNLCVAEEVELEAVTEMLKKPFNYDLHIWDREKSHYGYMTPFQALILRRPAATEAIELFLKKGVNPNKKTGMRSSPKTAFFHACSYAHFEEVKLMIPYVDINFAFGKVSFYDAPTALMSCINSFADDSSIKTERLNTYKKLLDEGADINYTHPDGVSAIMKIIDSGKVDYLELLSDEVGLELNYFKQVNEFYHNNYTPLSYCANKCTKSNHLGLMFEKLLELGADINMADGSGKTPLFYAVEGEMPHLCEDTAVNWDFKNQEGRTALLHYANLGRNKTEVPAFLLKQNVDIDAVDYSGNTALHLALKQKDSVLSLFLIKNGCKLDVVNAGGQRAIDIARDNNMMAVINKIEGGSSPVEIKIEDLCLTLLEQGFEYVFEGKKIFYRESGEYQWYYYKNKDAAYYKYRNYQCTAEWLREYFCALVLGDGQEEEKAYFLEYLNTFFNSVSFPKWTIKDLKEAFEASYLSEQIKIEVTKAEVRDACISYLVAGHSFVQSDKEGMTIYSYDKSSGQFHMKEDGYQGPSETWYSDSQFKEICYRVISKKDNYPYRMDFSGFFSRELQVVLKFLGFGSWRAWKIAERKK